MWLLPGRGCKDRQVWRTSPINITHCVSCYFSQTLISQGCPLNPRDLLIVPSPAARPAVICLELQMNAPRFAYFHHIVLQDKSPLAPDKGFLKDILSVNKQLLIVPEFDLHFVLIHQTPLNGFFHTPQISLKETPWNNESNCPWVRGVGCQKTTSCLPQGCEWNEGLVMLPALVESKLSRLQKPT